MVASFSRADCYRSQARLLASHQELANQFGTVREFVSRNLMRLQAEGLLDVDARQIVVQDLGGLRALLETTP